MPSPTPFTITELPTLTAEEAQARAKRAEARLQAPEAPPAQPAPQETPAPTAQPAPAKPTQAPPRQVFTLEQGLPRDITPKPLSPNQAVKQAVASNLATSRNAPEAVRDVAAGFADEETQRLLQRQMELRVASRDRAAAFLRERGYDEAVSLLPDGINLSDTRKKMEAAGLQRKAREFGHNNWFEVPAGPERDQAQKDVAAGVEQDLRRATTVGRGAIFIDPDPAGARAAIANAPLPLRAKMALTTLVPTAKATYSPRGAEFQTESPLGYLMRPVNAIGSTTVAPVEEALETAQPLKRIAQNRQAWDAGEVSTEQYLDELKSVASDSFRAATGIDPEASGKDWRDILVEDPKAQQALLDRVGTDPAAMVVGDQIADDLVEYYGAPDTLTHLLFIPAGFGVDLITPDPVGLGLAAAGAGAAKAGARLAGDSDDLLKAARDMRTAAAQEGATLDSTLQAARGSYNGLDQALALRVGARARVPTDVAAQVRRLETETVAAQLAAAKAQERATEAIGEADQFRAAQDALKSKRDAAKAALAEAETKAALADEGLDLYKKVGAPAVKKSEQFLKASEEATQEARLIEDEIAHVEATHKEVLDRLDSQNRALAESLDDRQKAADDLAVAQQALKSGPRATGKPRAALLAERDVAKARLKELEQEVKEISRTHRNALRDAEAPVTDMRKKGVRALELHTRAAELEQESAEGIRRIVTGTDIPGDRVSLKDIGARVAAARDVAHAVKANARDAFRLAATEAGRGEEAAVRAAEEEIKRIEGMMNTQMKADLLRERSILWKEEANKLADEIERGVASLRTERKVSPRRDGILLGTVLDEGRNGYLIDTDAFRAKVEREYTPAAVRWWVERAGDDQALWVKALGLDGRGKLAMTKKEALLLQQGERGILEGIKRTRGEAAAEAQVEALLQLRRDPAYKAADFQGTTTQKWMRHINDSLTVWVNALDPTAARIGDVGKDLLEISKAGNRICNNAGDEQQMLARLARQPRGLPGMYRTATKGFGGPADIIDVTFRYIDTTEPLQVFGRKTIFNTGAEAPWARGQRQFMTDPRVATHEALLANAKTQGVSVEEFLRSEAPGVANRPLLGLSRMWLKSGVGASERQSAYLFGEAKRLVAETGSLREFSEEMKKATQRAWTNKDMTAGGGFGPGAVEVHPQKAIGYGARCVAQAAAQADINDLFVRGLGGLFTAQEAEDAIRAATYNYDVIENPANVWEVYGRLSAPFTQRSIRDAESAVARTQQLIKTGSTRSGDPVFMLASQARELDAQLDNVVKEVHAQYGQARDINTTLKLKHVKDFNQLWKTSVTLGLLVPRPSYFMTNIFGNFSQMWLSGGIGQAARISFQSLPFGIPFIGEGLDKGMRMMSEAVGDVPFLGSMTNAWINPHLNRVFAGEQGVFKSKGGIDYDFDTIRHWLVDDGMTTTYMQEEFTRLYARAQGSDIWTKMSFLQDDIYSWAGEIEVRMRSALYMDYLQKGATRGEARDNSLRALYDWNGALGSTEANVFTWFIPFYRFIKLGVRQFAEEALSLPLRQPGEAAYKALVGQSGLARVNQQMKLTTIPELADDGNYADEQAKYDAMARYRDLDYLNKRVTWSERNDPETVEMYQKTRGQSLPYSSIALPGMTALDMGALAVLPFYAAAVVAAKAEGLAGGDADKYLAPDWSTAFLDAALSMSGPLTQPMIGAWGEAMGASSPRLAESVRLKPGETAVANAPSRLADMLGWEGYRAQQLGLPAAVSTDYQTIKGTPMTKAIVGSIPGLLQVPPMLDAFYYENPHLSHVAFTPEGAHATADFFAFGARQWSGAGRAYPYDPDQIVTQRQRDVGTTMRKTAEAQGAQLREKQVPKP